MLLGRPSLYGRGVERLHEELVPLTARWLEPAQRKGPLAPYARDAEAKTLDLLERTLAAPRVHGPSETIQARLLECAPKDIADLLPHLEPRAHELADDAVQELRWRGEREEAALRETFLQQQARVRDQLAKHESGLEQLTLGFDADDRRQLDAHIQAWRIRLPPARVRPRHRPPPRIRAFYEVQARSIEPVGLVYLWPDTN